MNIAMRERLKIDQNSLFNISTLSLLKSVFIVKTNLCNLCKTDQVSLSNISTLSLLKSVLMIKKKSM